MNFGKALTETFFAKGLVVVLGFLVSVLLARFFSVEELGIFNYIMSWIGIVLIVGTMGLTSTIAYYSARKRESEGTIISVSIYGSLVMGVISLLIFYGIFKIFPAILKDVEVMVLWVGLLAIPGFLMLNFLRSYYLGIQKIRSYNMIDIANRVIPVIAIIGALAVFGKTIKTVIAIQTCLYFIIIIYQLFNFSLKKRKSENSINKTLVKRLFTLGFRPYLITLLSFLVLRIDVLFINFFEGMTGVGIYTIAVMVAEYILILPNIIGDLLFTYVANLKDQDFDITSKILRINSVVMFLIILGMALGGKIFLEIAFGVAYLESYRPFLYLLPGIYAFGLAMVITNDFSARGYPWFQTLVWIPALVINIVGNFYLIPIYGITGAAISSSLTYWFVFLGLLFYYLRKYDNSLGSLFINRKDILELYQYGKSFLTKG